MLKSDLSKYYSCVIFLRMICKRISSKTFLVGAGALGVRIGILSALVRMCSCQVNYLNQSEASALDQELFNDYHFTVEQLMELAGLSVATAIANVFPVSRYKRVLVVCGPGNNGGDGLVAARHLAHFGYEPRLLYPRDINKTSDLYKRLIRQCTRSGIPLTESAPAADRVAEEQDLLVDALFGFSFKPPVREEFKGALETLVNGRLPVCSVDIPSGWDVERGPVRDENHLRPSLLVSLSAPKECAKHLPTDCLHYLGGRFLPREIQKKFKLNLPEYKDTEQVLKLA